MTVHTLLPTAAANCLQQTKVRPNTHRAKPHINVRKTHYEKAYPGEKHVPLVQSAHASVCFLTNWLIRQNVVCPADQMPQGMATERIAAEKNDVCSEHDRSDTETEMFFAVCSGEP